MAVTCAIVASGGSVGAADGAEVTLMSVGGVAVGGSVSVAGGVAVGSGVKVETNVSVGTGVQVAGRVGWT